MRCALKTKLLPPPTEILPSETPTETAPSSPTDTPTATLTETETPTDAPTLTPTDTPTDTPAQTPTETATLDASLTASPTETPMLPPTATLATPLTLLVNDTFDNGAANWTLGAGWSWGAQALQALENTEPATLNQGNLVNVVAQVRVHLSEGALQLTVRNSGAGGYAALLRADGQVGLFRDGILIQAAATPPIVPDGWRTLHVSALNDIVRVSVDGVEIITFTDSAPLPAGRVALQAFGTGASGLLVDDFALWVGTGEVPATLTPTALPTFTPTPTLSETPTVTVIPTPHFLSQPPLRSVFTTDFALTSGGDFTQYFIPSPGLYPHDTDFALFIAQSDQPTRLILPAFADIAVQAQVFFTAGSAQITIQESVAGKYTANLDTNGQVTMYRGAQVLGTAVASGFTAGQWHTLHVTAMGNTVLAAVDGVVVVTVSDPAPLPAGTSGLSGSNLGSGGLLVDDLQVWTRDDGQVMAQTAMSSTTRLRSVRRSVQAQSGFSLNPDDLFTYLADDGIHVYWDGVDSLLISLDAPIDVGAVGTVGSLGALGEPIWSPSRQRLAFDCATYYICLADIVVDTNGALIAQSITLLLLADNPHIPGFPRWVSVGGWSPDSRWIVYKASAYHVMQCNSNNSGCSPSFISTQVFIHDLNNPQDYRLPLVSWDDFPIDANGNISVIGAVAWGRNGNIYFDLTSRNQFFPQAYHGIFSIEARHPDSIGQVYLAPAFSLNQGYYQAADRAYSAARDLAVNFNGDMVLVGTGLTRTGFASFSEVQVVQDGQFAPVSGVAFAGGAKWSRFDFSHIAYSLDASTSNPQDRVFVLNRFAPTTTQHELTFGAQHTQPKFDWADRPLVLPPLGCNALTAADSDIWNIPNTTGSAVGLANGQSLYSIFGQHTTQDQYGFNVTWYLIHKGSTSVSNQWLVSDAFDLSGGGCENVPVLDAFGNVQGQTPVCGVGFANGESWPYLSGMRDYPSTVQGVRLQSLPYGTQVDLLAKYQGNDGWWWLVQLHDAVGSQGWMREDVLNDDNPAACSEQIAAFYIPPPPPPGICEAQLKDGNMATIWDSPNQGNSIAVTNIPGIIGIKSETMKVSRWSD